MHMDNYIYVFTRNDGRIILKNEKEADGQMFSKSGWEAKDITYLGRVAKQEIENVNRELSKNKSVYIKNADNLSMEEFASIEKERNEMTEVYYKAIRDLVENKKDLGQPRDFTVLDNTGRLADRGLVRN